MARSSVLNIAGKHAVALAALAGALIASPLAWAGPPTPFVMNTEIIFPHPGQAFGTFWVQEPAWICPAGTFLTQKEMYPPAAGYAFTAIVVVEYTCDDESGTFFIQFHPQWNPGTQGGGYWVSGPWSILSGGTGDYVNLRGHGEMGFNNTGYDPNTGEEFGEETFAGLVQMNQ